MVFRWPGAVNRLAEKDGALSLTPGQFYERVFLADLRGKIDNADRQLLRTPFILGLKRSVLILWRLRQAHAESKTPSN
jgi:hypothetical protein